MKKITKVGNHVGYLGIYFQPAVTITAERLTWDLVGKKPCGGYCRSKYEKVMNMAMNRARQE
jgi:hypothetical protein